MSIKQRKDCFVGIHFDFHAGDDCMHIGRSTTPEMIQQIIDDVHPDFLQCDCKGHRGLSSYPTKVANPAPGFDKDNLRIWRDVTKKNGVPLFMHYSGVYDREVCTQHPEWAVVNADGTPDKEQTSVYGPYVDKVLIPQITELIKEYGIDGMWVDGECWATKADFCEKARALYKEKTGRDTIPTREDDEEYYEYIEICRQGFRDYLNHYVTELHKVDPTFQIASNWAYTSMMPELPQIPVDFISGDYSPLNSYNEARFEARAIAPQPKPWDLMAWSFCGRNQSGISSTKTAIQLEQEAAAVLALGGGFQCYYTQKRDGSVKVWEMKTMGKVADFCRQYKEWCWHSKQLPDIAVYNGGYNFYRGSKRIFAAWEGEMVPSKGIVNAVLDNQYSAELLLDEHMEGRFDEFAAIVVPEHRYFKPEFIEKALEYVKKGGKLLLMGPTAGAAFAEAAGVEVKTDLDAALAEFRQRRDAREKGTAPASKPLSYNECVFIKYNDWMAGYGNDCLAAVVEPKADTKVVANYYLENDCVTEPIPAATVAAYGAGEIACVWVNLGADYMMGSKTLTRELVGGLLDSLVVDRRITIKGTHKIDVVLGEKNGVKQLHLVNTAGPHSDDRILVFDEIPEHRNVEISVKLDKKPEKVVVRPCGCELPFEYADGKVSFVLPKLEIYSIVEFL